MLHKLKKQVYRSKFTVSNRLPNLRSRQYLINSLRYIRTEKSSGPIRAAMGLVRWTLMKAYHKENRVSYKHSCLLSGRGRGISQRYSIARTKIKHFSNQGKLFGTRKSSW